MCTEVYLGCIDDAFWPGVPWRSYGHCAEDWVRGWVYDGAQRPIIWCLCDSHDDCNVNIGDAGSKPMSTLPTMTPATDSATTQRTQVHRSALPLRLSKAPFTRYNRLSNPLPKRLSNRLHNRLYRVYKHSTGCQTRSTTGLTKRLYRVYSRLSNRLYNPV